MLTETEIGDAMRYAEAERAASTRGFYRSDWRAFAAWCAARGASPLPAHPGLLAAYLSHLAQLGRKASTIGRALAAIADKHRQAGLESPTKHEGVRAVMRGIRRSIGTASVKKVAATADLIRTMLDTIDATKLIGMRDRALLALGFAGAFRRSEL